MTPAPRTKALQTASPVPPLSSKARRTEATAPGSIGTPEKPRPVQPKTDPKPPSLSLSASPRRVRTFWWGRQLARRDWLSAGSSRWSLLRGQTWSSLRCCGVSSGNNERVAVSRWSSGRCLCRPQHTPALSLNGTSARDVTADAETGNTTKVKGRGM